jgi:hypothetical protein
MSGVAPYPIAKGEGFPAGRLVYFPASRIDKVDE